MRTVSMTCSSARSGSPAATRPSTWISTRSTSLAGAAGDGVARRARALPRLVGPERARLHVLARQVALALEGAQVVVDAVRRPDAHARADLAQRRRVAAVVIDCRMKSSTICCRCVSPCIVRKSY